MNQVQQVEVTIEQAEAAIELNKQAMSLFSLPAFQAVIDDAYFRDETARLLNIKASPAGVDVVAHADRLLTGVGGLRNFFYTIMQNAAAAEAGLEEARHEADLAAEEEASE